VVRYALQAAAHLVERDIKCLVVACNTAAAAALEAVRERFGALPVLGVIEPGARAACAAAGGGCIAVIATEATVRGGAYQRAIARIRPDARVFAAACPLFVALAEEGWTEGEVAAAAARRYLEPLFTRCGADTLVLGCTHFPVLRAVIGACVGAGVALVDLAATTAQATQQLLIERALLRAAGARAPQLQFLATDNVERFAAVGRRFIERPLTAADVELVDP
jgi:glutamate racemase